VGPNLAVEQLTVRTIHSLSVPYGLTEIARIALVSNAHIATSAEILMPIFRIAVFAETAAANEMLL
jgi:hypothetical protein